MSNGSENELGPAVQERVKLLKHALLDTAVTFAAIARRCRVTKGVVSNVVRGRTTSSRIQRTIARAAGIPVAELWPSRFRPRRKARRVPAAAPPAPPIADTATPDGAIPPPPKQAPIQMGPEILAGARTLQEIAAESSAPAEVGVGAVPANGTSKPHPRAEPPAPVAAGAAVPPAPAVPVAAATPPPPAVPAPPTATGGFPSAS